MAETPTLDGQVGAIVRYRQASVRRRRKRDIGDVRFRQSAFCDGQHRPRLVKRPDRPDARGQQCRHSTRARAKLNDLTALQRMQVG